MAERTFPTPLTPAPLESPVEIVRSHRARRIALRFDPGRGTVRLTAPPEAPAALIEAFLARHHGWVAERLARVAPRTPFADGAVIPIEGEDHRIVHQPGRGAPVRRADGLLIVTGEGAHLPRRVADYLKAEARAALTGHVRDFAARLERPVAALVLGDPRSRWGSCTAKGRLMFSWRVILAPPAVLRYLAAHETAHLREMNHSAAFWALVAQLDPEHAAARRWLKTQGAGLHRYG